MANQTDQVNFSFLFERLEKLYEGYGAQERAIAAFSKRFELLKEKGVMTDENWEDLKALDYTVNPDYITDSGPSGKWRPGSLSTHIFNLFFNEVAKPSRDVSIPPGASEEQKQSILSNQYKEIAQKLRVFWEDAYKIKEYIKIFVENSKLFPQEFTKYKSFDEFKKDAVNVKEKLAQLQTSDQDEEVQDSATTEWNRNKLLLREKYKKYFLGTVPGTQYDVYELPKGMSLEQAKAMQCDLGTGTEWCTVPKTGTWLKGYLDENALYIFYGSGPTDRYQFFYGDPETGSGAQFMDYKDESILDQIGVEEEEDEQAPQE